MKNILIVESENDKYFIEALISQMQIENVEVSRGIICKIDDYECLEGLSEKKLKEALQATINQVKKKKYQKIGILIDQDNKTQEERIKLVNDAISKTTINQENIIQKVGELFPISLGNREVQIGTYFINVSGQGELETVLRKIKSKESIYADCLQSWQDCLIENKINDSKGLKQKDFDKFWVQVFIRYDACSKKEQKQAGRKCSLEASMSKPIWNFQAECLNELRNFLYLFSDNTHHII